MEYANQLPQSDFLYLNTSSTPIAHQWTAQPQNLAPSQAPFMSYPDVQTLRQQLDTALRKIREYEDTILHQATVSRQSFYSLRTEHGVICPCCKQVIAHACSPPTHSLIGPSNMQLPLSRQSSVANSAFASHSTNAFPYPSTSGPQLTVPLRTSAVPSYPAPCLPSPTHGGSLGKRELHRTDLDCESGRQKTKKKRNTEQRKNWSIEYSDQVARAITVKVHSWDVDAEVVSLRFSNDCKYLAVGCGRNGATNIYDVHSGKKTCALRDLASEKNTVHTLCFSPDGLYLATGGSDGLVRIWQISKRHVRNAFESVYNTSIDFSPDGRLIALGTDLGGGLEILNWRDDTQKFFAGFQPGAIIRFSPDGQYIAAGLCYGDAVILIWNVRTGHLVEKLGGLCNRVESLAFTPDGTRLVTGGCGKNNAIIWDMGLLGMEPEDGRKKGSGKELLNFRGHKHSVSFVAVSSNGRWVISAADDGACVWDVHTGELHCKLGWFGFALDNVLAFGPASSCFVSACQDGRQVLFWRFM